MTKTFLFSRRTGSRLFLALIFCFFSNGIFAQNDDSPPFQVNQQPVPEPDLICGLNSDYIRGLEQPVAPTGPAALALSLSSISSYASIAGYSTSAVMTCGKFEVYFDDVNLGLPIGFNDPTASGSSTIGVIRQNTFCHVLTYIQNTFDFSGVSASDPVKIHVAQSYDPYTGYHAPSGTSYFAIAGPMYTAIPNSIIAGFVNEYVTTGTNPTTGFHANLQVNFDGTSSGPIYYQNDDLATTFPNCNMDLYTVLLHEMGHALGWMSFVEFTPTSSISGMPPSAILSGNTFSKLDYAYYTAPNTYPLSGSFVKLINGPVTAPTLGTSSSLNCSSNYWVSNQSQPDNHPVYSGQNIGPWAAATLVPSYLHHLDDQIWTYPIREHISPGNREEYVMGPIGMRGVLRRTYTKGEIQTFCNTLNYTYAGSSTSVMPNHVPHSAKMAAYPLTTNWLGFTETVSSDFTMTNNCGNSITIDLSTLTSDITDIDGDPVSVDPATLINLRGCGSGSGPYATNNHSLLSLSAGDTKITYSPRADFYGRAQFGFNLYDGKEDGSFYVVTIDVAQGSCPSCAPGSNLVLNPNFEYGTEVKRVGSEETIPYDLDDHAFQHEGKWQSVILSDAHPWHFGSNAWMPYGAGDIVGYAHADCSIATILKETFGAATTSFPGMGSYANPMSIGSGNERYQAFAGPGGASFYSLCSNVVGCHKYILEFDAEGPSVSGSTPMSVDVKFKDATSSFTSPSFNYNFTYAFPSGIGSSWQHITIPFWYCGGSPSNILYLQDAGTWKMVIDNLDLHEDLTPPPPLVASITSTVIPPCTAHLEVTATNSLCTTTYLWSTGATTTTIDVTPAVTTVYSVTVSDGCRTVVATYTVVPAAADPITGPGTVCIGQTITLSDATAGGTWSSSYPGVGSIDATGVVTGVAAGTTTISYSNSCGYVTYIVTVVPDPSPILGTLTVCAGSTTALSDATSSGTWDCNPVTIATISSTGVVSGISSGTAIVTYTVGTCSVTAVVTVNSTPDITSVTATPPVICAGESTVLEANTTFDGTGSPVYTWSPATGVTTSAATVTPAVTTTYTVTATSGSCSTTGTVTVTVNPAPVIAPGYLPMPLCDKSLWTLYSNTSAGCGGGCTYAWSGPGGFTSASDPVPMPPASTAMAGVYNVTVTNSDGCTTTGSVNVIVNLLPPGDITAGGPTTFCDPGSVVLSTTAGAGYTYQWYNSAGPIPGETNDTYTATTSETYYVVVTSSAGCAVTSLIITVVVNPTPVIAPGYLPMPLCDKSLWTLYSNTSAGCGGGCTYAWSGPGGFTSASDPVPMPPASPAMAGVYNVTVTNSDGCTATGSVNVIVNLLPPGDITAGGPTTFCDPGSVVLSTTAGAGYTYQWYNSAGPIPGETNDTYTATTSETYYVVVTSSAGCSVTSLTITVVVNPTPVIAPDYAPIPLCEGTLWTLSSNTSAGCSGGCTYSWSGPGGFTSALDPVSMPAATPAMGGSYVVTVTNTYGCSATGTVNVIVNPLPPGDNTPGGPTTFCDPGSVVLSTTPGAGYTYQWYNSAGAILGETGDSYTATTSETYYVIVTSSAGCSITSSSITVTATPTPTATATYTGCNPVCIGSPVTINITGTPGATIIYDYTWPETFPSTVTSLPVPIGPVTLVPPTSETSGTFNFNLISVTKDGCTSTIGLPINIVVQDPVAEFVQPIPTPCEGMPYSILLSGTAGSTANFTDGTSVYTVNFVGTPGTIVTVSVPMPGIYGPVTLCITSVFGCSCVNPGPFMCVTVIPNPNPVLTLGYAPAVVCAGSTFTLTAGGSPCVSYTYTAPGTGSFISYPSPYTTPLTSLAATGGGTYCVTGVDMNGCISLPVCTTVTVTPLPTATWTGSTTCENLAVPTITITGTPGSVIHYQMRITLPSGLLSPFMSSSSYSFTLPSGSGSSVTATFPVTMLRTVPWPTINSVFRVTSITGPTGCLALPSSFPATCTVTVYQQPYPVVHYIPSGAYSGLWDFTTDIYGSGVSLHYNTYAPGHLPFPSGSYSTTVLLTSGLIGYYDFESPIVCADIDFTYNGPCTWPVSSHDCKPGFVYKPGSAEGGSGSPVGDVAEFVSVVPNPTQGDITIDGVLSSLEKDGAATIRIMDLLGKVHYENVVQISGSRLHNKITLDNTLANGIYIIKIKTAGNEHVARFVLNR